MSRCPALFLHTLATQLLSFASSFQTHPPTPPRITQVAWTEDYEDISGPTFPTPRFFTRSKMRWDDNFLYVGGYLHEPNVWLVAATLFISQRTP